MKIQVFDRQDQMIAVLGEDEEKMLGFYPVQDYFRLHVRG
jgi:hypothetical protein